MDNIIVEISGGVVDDVGFPPTCSEIVVEVWDYDIDIFTDDELKELCKKDEKGDWYLQTLWKSNPNEVQITAQQKLIETCVNLIDNLEEAHQDELQNNHHGDNPDNCRYCSSIQNTRLALAEFVNA